VNPAVRTEAIACLRLAGPLIVAQLSFIGITVTDTLMAGRLGEATLAAVAMGGNLWMPPFLFFMGICLAVAPMVAQLFGAGVAPATMGAVMRRTLVAAMMLGLLWWGLMHPLSRWVLDWLELSPQLHSDSMDYVHAISWGAPAACLFFVLRSGSEAIGFSRPIMVCGLAGLALNILLDYLLMFGRWGFPAMGATGAGLASAISLWFMAAALAGYYAWHRHYRAFALFTRGLAAPTGAVEMLRIGLPMGITLVMEAGIFSLVGLLMARFNSTAVAAHQIAISFAAFTFMVPLGVAMATTARVGQARGRGDGVGVRRAGTVGIGLALGFNLVSTFIMLVFPRQVVALYTEAPEVSELAVQLLRLAGLFQLWDALQVSANGALRGLKDTRVPMLLTLLAYWAIGLPIGYGLGFGLGQGPSGLWIGFIAGLFAAAAFLNTRFYRLTKSL
jgi:multidrug resistance protein, MATE family